MSLTFWGYLLISVGFVCVCVSSIPWACVVAVNGGVGRLSSSSYSLVILRLSCFEHLKQVEKILKINQKIKLLPMFHFHSAAGACGVYVYAIREGCCFPFPFIWDVLAYDSSCERGSLVQSIPAVW